MTAIIHYRLSILLIVLSAGLLGRSSIAVGDNPVLIDGGASLTAIVVDLGAYPDAWAAGNSENQVDWFDRDPTADRICTEAFAALELRYFLCRLGGLLPSDRSNILIVDNDSEPPDTDCLIVVGQAVSGGKYDRLDREIDHESPEAFLIRAGNIDGKEVVILRGKGRVGTLYAVYELLRRLGCRWYGPGRTGEHIPLLEKVAVEPIDFISAPSVDVRGFWVESGKVEAGSKTWTGSYTDRGNADFFDWMARNRLNYFWNKERDWRGMKKRGIRLNCGGHDHYLELLHPETPYPYDHPEFEDDNSLSPDPYPMSDEYAGDRDGDGVLEYSEAHPEWYGLDRNGNRFFPTERFGINYCSTSESGFAEFMKNVIGYLRDGIWYNADIFDFWPLDGGNWCNCPDCQSLGNETDQLLHVVYRIRKRLHQAYLGGELNRDVPVYSLVYIQTEVLPSRDLPPDFDLDNTALVYFPIGRCYAHRFDDPACTEMNAGYLATLEGWRAPDCRYRGRLFLGEYYNISGFRDLPLVFMSTMARDIPFFVRSGVSGFHYMHTSTADLGVRRLTNYQMARTLWDAELDSEAFLSDYFEHFYGPAARPMEEFYRLLEQTTSNVRAWRYFLRPQMIRTVRGKADSPFPIRSMPNHLHYEEYHPATDDALDWIETMAGLSDCRRRIDAVLAMELPSMVRLRVDEDEYGFRYLEYMLNFYDSLLSLLMIPEERKAERRMAFDRAVRYFDLLKSYVIKSPALGVADAYQAADLMPVFEYFRREFEK